MLKEDPLTSGKRTSRFERYESYRGRYLLSLYEQYNVQLLYLLTNHLFQQTILSIFDYDYDYDGVLIDFDYDYDYDIWNDL